MEKQCLSKEEKLAIIKEAEDSSSISAVLKKYGIAPSLSTSSSHCVSPGKFYTHYQATKQKNLPLMKPEWKLIDINLDSSPKNHLKKFAFVCKTV